jgi:hypothetical protein
MLYQMGIEIVKGIAFIQRKRNAKQYPETKQYEWYSKW